MKKTLIALLLALVVLFSACEQVPTVNPNQPSGPSGGNPVDTCDDGEHTDSDDNGLCDKCTLSVITVIDFYVINDLHGKFDDSASQEGVDELTTYLKNAHKTDEHVVILSSGDMWQGSTESGLTKGLIITDWMNELGFASMTLGNHEFDWGEEYIEKNAELAQFPILAINVYDTETNQRVDYCQPSVLIERGDIKIGIIGAIGDCYSSIAADNTKGVYFKVGSELTELVKAEADSLRLQGADFIVYSLHDGTTGVSGSTIGASKLSAYYDASLSKGYVDIVFEGHSHSGYAARDFDKIYHLQGGGENRGISHAEVKINFANGNYRVETAEYVTANNYTSLEDDPLVDSLLEKYKDDILSGNEELGYNDTYRESYELSDLVAQLYVEKAIEVWGDRFDIVLGGGSINARSPYNLDVGPIKYSHFMSIFPFDNQLVLCSISGRDLLDRFLNNEDYYIALSDYGYSVIDDILPAETYYIITDTWNSPYVYNGLTEIERLGTNLYARDLLAQYARDGGFGTKPDFSGEYELTSIADALAIGNALEEYASTDEKYYIKGTVTEIESTKYGNLYIEDENGDSIYLYGLYDRNGVRYDSMDGAPAVGDTITVYAPIKKYMQSGSPLIELDRAILISK